MESEASDAQPEVSEQSEVTVESTKPIKKVCSPAKMEALARLGWPPRRRKKPLVLSLLGKRH